MKTKFSKRMLSILLSALMVITSVPLFALTAEAALDYTDLDAAITAYETKMNGVSSLGTYTIYSNLEAGYNAYIHAKAVRDAYEYGTLGSASNAQSTIDAEVTALTNATDAMAEWTVPAFDYVPTYGGIECTNGKNGQDLYKYYDNMVYMSGTFNFTSGNSQGCNDGGFNLNDKRLSGKSALPSISVMAFDGRTAPAAPVIFQTFRWSSGNGKDCHIGYIATDNTNFGFNSNWRGYAVDGGSSGFVWNTWAHDSKFEAVDGWGYSSATSSLCNKDLKTASNLTWQNKAVYFPTTWSGSSYYKTETINNLTVYSVCKTNNTNNNNTYTDTCSTTTNTSASTFYFVNYKPIVDNVKKYADAVKTLSNSNSISKYVMDKPLTNIFKVLDIYTSRANILPTYYTWNDSNAATNVTNWANNISSAQTAVSNLGTVSTTFTATSNTGYDNLKAAYNSNVVGAYGTNNVDPSDGMAIYSTDSWNTFASAFTAGKSVFDGLVSNGYTNSGANTAGTNATSLTNAYNALVPLSARVNTAVLEAAIDDARYAIANSHWFTDESYDQGGIGETFWYYPDDILGTGMEMDDYIADVIANVWYSSIDPDTNEPKDNYKTDLKLRDIGNNQQTVNTYAQNIQNAVSLLVISRAYSSPEHPLIQNGTANYLSLYKATNVKNGFTLGNYTTTSAAALVTACNNCAEGNVNLNISGAVAGNVQARLNYVKSLLQAVIDAVGALKPAFALTNNETIISNGTDANVHLNVSDGSNNGKYWLEFTTKNNPIRFRVMRDEYEYYLGTADFTWYNSSDYDAHLDSISMHDTNGTTGNLVYKNGSVTGGDPEGEALSGSEGGFIQGNLNAVGSHGEEFRLRIIRVTQASSEAIGREGGNNISLLDTVFDEHLKYTTTGSDLPSDAITAKGYTYFSGQYFFYIPASDVSTDLTRTNIPFKTTFSVSTYFGMVYWWKRSTAWIKTAGYDHDRVAYSRSVDVCDITTLLELINECSNLDQSNYLTDGSYTPGKTYTVNGEGKGTWQYFQYFLGLANAELNYESMTAAQVISNCVTRYQNLWDARNALKTCASNQSIKNAVNDAEIIAAYNRGNTGYYDGVHTNYDNPWTQATWTAFKTAYETAEAIIDNSDSSAIYNNTNITALEGTAANQALVDAYATAIYDAYNALAIRQIALTFTYKDSTGTSQSTTVNVDYNSTLKDNKTAIQNAVTPSDYDNADHSITYVYDGTWTPALNLNDATNLIKLAASYDAITGHYTERYNYADWTSYNAAESGVTGLRTKLAAGKSLNEASGSTYYSYDALVAARNAIAGYTYWTTPTATRETTIATSINGVQTVINNEAADIQARADALVPFSANSIDLTAAQAVKTYVDATLADELATQGKGDIDQYGTAPTFDYKSEVVIEGNSYAGLLYTTQAELDSAIQSAIEGMNAQSYTVELNGVTVGTYAYGTTLNIDDNGAVLANANAANGDEVAWYYSYKSNTVTQWTTAKYSGVSDTYSFVVKGDTKIETRNASSSGSEAPVVKIVARFEGAPSSNKILTVLQTTKNGNVYTATLPELTPQAFYALDTSTYVVGSTISVTEDTTVYADYLISESTGYYITGTDCYFDEVYNDCVPFNTLVTLTDETGDAYVWVKVGYDDDLGVETYRVVAFGDTYSFYAYEDADYYAFDQDTFWEKIMDPSGGMVIDGQGNGFVSPDGYTRPAINPTNTATIFVNNEPIYVYDGSTISKIKLIGTFTVPSGYTLVEAGILFTTNATASDLTIEKVGTKGIARMKASYSTVGNQIAINVGTSTWSGTKTCKYVGYAIVEKKSNSKRTTVYSSTVSEDIDF